jgi:arsenate reductase (glutaredoxin)
LTAKGIDFESVHYIEKPLSARGLRQLLHCAGLKPQDAVRKNESAYREHAAGKNLNDAQLIELMAKWPELIQRPIVVRGKKGVLARPVEKLSELNFE